MVYLLLLDHKLYEGRGLVLFCSMIYAVCLEQGRHPIYILNWWIAEMNISQKTTIGEEIENKKKKKILRIF